MMVPTTLRQQFRHGHAWMVAVLVLILPWQLAMAQEATAASLKLNVYHKWGNDFVKRGEIVGLPNEPTFVPDNSKFAQVQVTSESGPFYQVKIRNENTGRIILSSVKYCQLIAGNWNDEFRVHLDETGQVYHVDYYAQGECTEDVKLPAESNGLSSKVKVVKPARSAKPVLGQFGGKKQKQTRSSTTQQQQQGSAPQEMPVEEEEKTFFQKYWYLILAGAFVLLSSAGAPPEQTAPARR